MTHQVFDDFLWKGGLYSKALIPRNQFLYSLSPLSVVMEHVIPQHCPLNVIYIRVLRGHFAKESLEHVDAGARQLFSRHVQYL